MNTLINHILVFKTNILSNHAEAQVAHILNAHPNIMQWNVDHDDIDEVLRIVALGLDEAEVIYLLGQEGLHCEPLPDSIPAGRL